MPFITDVNEFQALLSSFSSTCDWEMLTESVLILDEWIPIAYARLSELTAQELPVSNLFSLSSLLIFFVIGLVSTLNKRLTKLNYSCRLKSIRT